MNPGVGIFDVTGMGKSKAFGVNVGTNPATLLRKVNLKAGAAYLLLTDFAGRNGGVQADPDGGRWEFLPAGKRIETGGLGFVRSGETVRRKVCVIFTPLEDGFQDFLVRIQRGGGSGPVRTWVDNIRIQSAEFPILCVGDPRIVGTRVAFTVIGTPKGAFFMFVSPFVLGGGMKVQGVPGVWYLSPVGLLPIFYGALGAGGRWSTNLLLPKDPLLAGVPLYYQGVEFHPVTSAPRIGTLADYPLIH